LFHTAQIRREGESIPASMTRVREWLIEQQIEPDRLRCATDLKGVTLQLDFSVEGHAKAFADYFGGTFSPGFGPHKEALRPTPPCISATG
jgi:hypothetical protein